MFVIVNGICETAFITINGNSKLNLRVKWRGSVFVFLFSKQVKGAISLFKV